MLTGSAAVSAAACAAVAVVVMVMIMVVMMVMIVVMIMVMVVMVMEMIVVVVMHGRFSSNFSFIIPVDQGVVKTFIFAKISPLRACGTGGNGV